MIHAWLVSGLTVVDSGLQFYWEVRRMVFDEKEEDTTLTDAKKESCTRNSQEYGRNSNFKELDSATTSCSMRQMKATHFSKRQSLPAKLDSDDVGSMGWSRPQDNAYRYIGCKSVVRISSSSSLL